MSKKKAKGKDFSTATALKGAELPKAVGPPPTKAKTKPVQPVRTPAKNTAKVKAKPSANGKPTTGKSLRVKAKTTVLPGGKTSGSAVTHGIAKRPPGMETVDRVETQNVPASDSAHDVHHWAETVRSEYVFAGKWPTVRALGLLLRDKLGGPEKAKKALGALKTIYAKELSGEKKKPGARKKVTKAEKRIPVTTKALAVKVPAGVKIPVTAMVSDGGKHRVRIWDHPLRAVLRWMGANGWSNGQALDACHSMGLNDRITKVSLAGKLVPDHCGSGRKGGKKSDGWHGSPASLTKNQIAELNKLKK